MQAYPELAAHPRQSSRSPDLPAVGDNPGRANPVPGPASQTEDGEENPDQGSYEDGQENPDPGSHEDGQEVIEEICILYILIVLLNTR